MALLQVNFFSNVLGMNMGMNVILPQRTNNDMNLEGKVSLDKYPTLYLLHGMSNDHTSWIRKTSIERYASDYGIAVVMPDTHLAWYNNTSYGLKYWDFISEELPNICREFFPNMSDKREDTFAAGLSMGGYGAFKLGLNKPDKFAAVASLSGALDIANDDQAKLVVMQNINFWQGVFGDINKLKNSENDLFFLAEKLSKESIDKPKFFMWCGEQDFLYNQNVNAKEHFTNLGLDLTYSFSNGAHEWKYWDEKIQDVLEWLPIKK